MKNEEDWLDALLHDDARETVADAGFTQRVMQSLPPSSQNSMRFERWTLIGALIGTLISLADGAWPSPEVMSASIASLSDLRWVGTQALTPWLATLLVAGALAYGMLEEPR